MYKVLIVDDEKIVRIALKSIISWNEEGFEVCNSAANAKEALFLIKKEKPHLIITDIEMPDMSGIDLIKAAKSLGYKGEWIILTNHENFSYAKEAIQLKVVDYIIKTDISKQLLTKVISKIKKRFDDLHLCDTSIIESELKKDSMKMKLNLNTDDLHFDNGYLLYFIFLEIGFKALENNLLNIANETIGDLKDGLVELDPQSLVLLIKKDDIFNFYSNIQDLSKKILSVINLYMNCNCSFVISPIIENNTNIIPIINKAKKIQHNSFYLGYGNIFNLEDAKEFSNESISFISEYKRIIVLINNFQFVDAKKIVLNWLEYTSNNFFDIQRVISLTDKIINLLQIDYKPYLKDLSVKKFPEPISITSLKNNIYSVLDEIERGKVNYESECYREEIRTIIKYVKENIEIKFTLNILANTVGMTESYLSRLFKNETKVNLIYYINLLKLEKAKEKLLDNNCCIKMVSYELGFDVVTYFNKLFSSTYLITPTDYTHYVNDLKS